MLTFSSISRPEEILVGEWDIIVCGMALTVHFTKEKTRFKERRRFAHKVKFMLFSRDHAAVNELAFSEGVRKWGC